MKKYLPLLWAGLAPAPLLASVVLCDLGEWWGSFFAPTTFLAIAGAYTALAIAGIVIGLKRHKPRFYDFGRFVLVFLLVLILGYASVRYGMLDTISKTSQELGVTGRVAYLFLALSLVVSPIASLLGVKKLDHWIEIRKILGILCFLFVVKHALAYLHIERDFYDAYGTDHSGVWSYVAYVLKDIPDRVDVIVGIFAGAFMVALGATSNLLSYSLLGRGWKTLHRLVYPAYLVTMLHVAFASAFNAFYAVSFALVAILRFAVFIRSFGRSAVAVADPNTAKRWLCVVCGYVYDEALGDPDSGIAPGTRFVDIPDDWTCPLCGVTKKDFSPLPDTVADSLPVPENATIEKIRWIAPDVAEVTIVADENFGPSEPGQFMRLGLKDFDGTFSRTYSVAHEEDTRMVFLIRARTDGRGGRYWRHAEAWNKLPLSGPFGGFTLRHTDAPKVFVATGTGLAPIYRMMRAMRAETPKTLHFGGRVADDIFYREELSAIGNLDATYWLSRESREGFTTGRIDLARAEFAPETEFYLCGAPEAVESFKKTLAERGYANVYAEVFN